MTITVECHKANIYNRDGLGTEGDVDVAIDLTSLIVSSNAMATS
jgi:hypothetical protein